MPDLLRLEPPRLVRGAAVAIDAVSAGQAWEWVYPGDLFHLLVNPVAGNAHPLGRRLHPYGRFSEGIAVDAALKLFGSTVRPARIDLQWVRPVRGQADFQLLTTVEAVTPEQVVLANSVRESGIEVARVKLTLARVGAGAAVVDFAPQAWPPSRSSSSARTPTSGSGPAASPRRRWAAASLRSCSSPPPGRAPGTR